MRFIGLLSGGIDSPVAMHLHMATTFGSRTTATLLYPMSSPPRLVAARGRARRQRVCQTKPLFGGWTRTPGNHGESSPDPS